MVTKLATVVFVHILCYYVIICSCEALSVMNALYT